MLKILVIALFFLVSCGPAEHSPFDVSEEVGMGVEKCIPAETEVIVFEDVQREIFQSSCAECHSDSGGNPKGVNLENFATVKAHLVKSQIEIQTGNMPPSFAGGELADSKKDLLTAWIDSGASETLADIVFCDN